MATASNAGGDWRHVDAAGSTPPFSVFTKPVVKSPRDDREYRLLKLDNGLQVCLVSDVHGDKAAASLDVAVGHLSDPDDMPGLAHFCEHLLFMGTEQYPKENEYSEYLAKNSGSSNAFTATTNTNYYFNVATPALGGALSRFAGFFHSPLFSPSCTSRELNAVDSEHKKNLQSDIWRIFQVNKHLSKDGHVWRKFGTGNRDSLEGAARTLKQKGLLDDVQGTRGDSLTIPGSYPSSRAPSPTPSEMEEDGGAIGRETRRRLLEWWTREYCASRMRLCVIGRESLDELAEMVVPLFSPVVNRGQVGLPMFTEHPFGPNESGTAVAVQTIMDIHLVEISFPFPWQPPYWEHAPANFLSHFLGHEGPGSLHSYLKKKGWITMLNAGPQNLARGFAMFKATIHLTKDGFKNYREIILATCKYLTLLRTSQFSPWQQQELCLLARTRFQFQEKNRVDDYAQWISDHMSWPVPKENVLSAAQLIAEWGPEGREEADVRQMLDYLQLNKGRAILMAQGEELETLGENGKWQSEPIYGTQFRVERFDEAFLKEALGPNDIKELFLPGPNEFIPKNLDVDKKEITEPAKRPFLIRQTSHSTLWHKKDDTFWVPKSSALINIHSAQVNTSARANVKTRLWTQLVMDSLNEYGYDAELAGLRYHVSADARGVGVALGGYNDKLPVLAHHVLERLRNIKIDPERLAVIKESTKREWQNVFLRETYWIAMLYEAYVLSKDQWSMEEKLQELSDITTEEIQQHVQDVMARTFTEMLLVGNVHKEEALEFAEVVERTIGSAPLDPEAVADRALIIPQGSNYVWSTAVQNPNESNSALLYFMHVGDGNDARTRVISALLSQLLSEPAFNTLRTKEQLGYIVSCSQEVLARGTQVGVKFLVQSERQPAYLEERVELFLEDMSGRIAEMDDAEFEQQKESLVRKWREKLKNTREEANRYWKYIDAGNLDFCRRDNDAVLLERVTKADVLALYGAKIHPSSPTRGKLSVHLLAQKAQSKKASATALSAFDGILRDAGVPTEGGAWKEQVAGDAEPLLSDVTKYWQARLAAAPAVSAEKAQELLGKLAMLADEHPAESAYEGKLRDSVVLVDDVKAFKAILEVAPSPKPVVEWGDLPVSKL